MITQNETAVLLCFFPKLESLSTKEIEMKTGFSHDKTFRTLQGLVNRKFLSKKQIGGTNIFNFEKSNRDLTYLVFVHYMTNRRLAFRAKHNLLYRRLYEFLNEVKPEGPAVIFGSYAKGIQTEKSDVDILIATKNKNAQKIAQTYKTRYRMNIQPVVVVPLDFKNIKRDNPTFWKDLIEFGIVLDGLDWFFKEVYAGD